MVGTGILTTSGFTVASVGSHQWAWLLWIIGGLLAICGALTQAELAVRNPRSGGDYIILSRAYGPMAGFLSGWCSVVLGFAGPIAASAKAAATYALRSFQTQGQPLQPILVSILATTLVLALAWSHSHSHRRSSLTQNAATILKVCFLLLFMAAGLALGLRDSTPPADWPATINSELCISSLTSLIYISYAYTGWNSIGYIAGEIDRPQRNLPLAILIGTLFVTILYLGLNLVYGLAWSAADLKQLAQDQGFDALAPIAELSAGRLFGKSWGSLLSFSVALMLVASVSAYVLAGPRIIHAMSQAGHFPYWAGQLNANNVPTRATAIQILISLGFIWSASLESIIVTSSVGLALFSMLTISSIFHFRKSQAIQQIDYQCPLYPVVPLVYLLGTGLLTGVTIWQKGYDGLLAVASIFLRAFDGLMAVASILLGTSEGLVATASILLFAIGYKLLIKSYGQRRN